MRYKISENCIACGACEMNCPVGAISMGDGKMEIVHLYAQLEHQIQMKNNSKFYDDRVKALSFYLRFTLYIKLNFKAKCGIIIVLELIFNSQGSN